MLINKKAFAFITFIDSDLLSELLSGSDAHNSTKRLKQKLQLRLRREGQEIQWGRNISLCTDWLGVNSRDTVVQKYFSLHRLTRHIKRLSGAEIFLSAQTGSTHQETQLAEIFLSAQTGSTHPETQWGRNSSFCTDWLVTSRDTIQ